MIKSPIKRRSVASRLFLVHLVFVVLLSTLAFVGLWLDAQERVQQNAEERTRAISSSIADDPYVLDSVGVAEPSTLLEPYALKLMSDAHMDFITIMSPTGIRYTHRNPGEIGKKYIGTIAPVQAGHSLTETYTGTLGPSVRSVYPILDHHGDVVAMVSAGVTVGSVAAIVNTRLGFVIGAAALLLLLGGVAAVFLRRYLDRLTHGMGAEELERMFSYYEAVLYSVREGLLLVDPSGQLTLYNEQAAQLLNLPPIVSSEHRGRMPVSTLQIPDSLRTLLASGERVHDLVQMTDDRILVVNQERAQPPPGSRRRFPVRLGTVTTIRDHTELQRLTGELETMRTLADSLRSQTHEFSNKLHTIVSLIELGRTAEALDFVTDELRVNQLLADHIVSAIDEPVLAALALGKTAQAQERRVDLRLTVSSPPIRPGIEPAQLVTIVGNLLDNAIDAAADSEGRWVSLDIGHRREADGSQLFVVVVADSGNGISTEDATLVFERGYSTKDSTSGRGYGLALVAQAVRRQQGSITVSDGASTGAVFTVTLPSHAALAPDDRLLASHD